MNTVAKDKSAAAAIDHGYHWRRVDADTPIGVKMQLINRRYGVATYGMLTSDKQFFTHWAPLPTFKD